MYGERDEARFQSLGPEWKEEWSCLLPKSERLQECKIKDVFEYREIEMIISYANGNVRLLVAYHSVEFR